MGYCYWHHLQDLQFLFYVWMGIAMSEFNKPTEPIAPKSSQEFYDDLRNQVIDEVVRETMKLTSFGKDTLDSLIITYQRMKK
ncbi:MAG: hypothetical protein EBT78_15155 [Betaproteobacteria bacterium]|nr:hypothetical protein [Betaproteobacteria bacterium]